MTKSRTFLQRNNPALIIVGVLVVGAIALAYAYINRLFIELNYNRSEVSSLERELNDKSGKLDSLKEAYGDLLLENHPEELDQIIMVMCGKDPVDTEPRVDGEKTLDRLKRIYDSEQGKQYISCLELARNSYTEDKVRNTAR